MGVRTALVPLAIGVAHAVVAAVVTLLWHPIEVPGPEGDCYVNRVQDILAGGSGFDRYHPTHLPLLGAAISWSTGCSAFTALRLISAASGGLLVASTYVLGERLAGRAGAWAATAAIAAHPGVLLLSLQASTDALAAGLALAMLVAAVRTVDAGRPAFALLTGLCFGLGLGTRQSFIGLLPALFAPLLTRRRATAIAATVLGALLGYAAHAVNAWMHHGSPFTTDNWRNLALKVAGFDGRILLSSGAGSPMELVREHWVQLLTMGSADLWGQLSGGLGRILLGGGPDLLAVPLAIGIVIAAVRLAWIGMVGRLLVASAACFLLMVCFTFVPSERVLLPLLPLTAVTIAGATHARRWLRWAGVIALALVAVIGACRLPERLREFVDSHPFAEIQAAVALVDDPDVLLVATTFPPMSRHVSRPVAFLYAPPLGSIHDLDDLLHHLRREQGRTGANGLVVGRRTEPAIHHWLLTAEQRPDLEIVRRDEDVVVAILPVRRLQGSAAREWFEAFTAEPSPWREGPLSLSVEVPSTVTVEQIARVEVVVQMPGGEGPIVELQPRMARRWQATLDFRPPPGEWQLQARMRLDDGTIVIGPETALVVR